MRTNCFSASNTGSSTALSLTNSRISPDVVFSAFAIASAICWSSSACKNAFVSITHQLLPAPPPPKLPTPPENPPLQPPPPPPPLQPPPPQPEPPPVQIIGPPQPRRP